MFPTARGSGAGTPMQIGFWWSVRLGFGVTTTGYGLPILPSANPLHAPGGVWDSGSLASVMIKMPRC